MARSYSSAQFLIFFLCHMTLIRNIPGISSLMIMRITSSCDDTIWPAIVSKPDSPELPKNMTGFALLPGESKTVSTPSNWNGMVWGRKNCQSTTGAFICGTGGCGSYDVSCPGGTALPSTTTLAYFTPNGDVGGYTYFVTLAKGFNLEITVVPRGNNNNNNINGGADYYCKATGCGVDLNKVCPKELQILGQENDIIGCNSACEAFKEFEDHYCGRPSTYSDNFKSFCPSTMAFVDDKTNTIFECASADYYDINFCSSSFPSTPPSGSSRSNSPDWYSPGEEELMDNRGKSTPLMIKIVAALFGITGVGLLTMLGQAIWSLYRREDHNCPLCNLVQICVCCNNWMFCNCCNDD